MAQKLRIEFPGVIYNISVRMLGNWKTESNRLFEDDAKPNRFRLLNKRMREDRALSNLVQAIEPTLSEPG
jgi:hypothetical protein